MVFRKVLVIDNNQLLSACIKSLLANEAELHVITISPENEAALIHKIWHLKPDVVILDEDSPLTSPMRLLSRLENYPKLRLIIVNAYNNWVQVYDTQSLQNTWTSTSQAPVSFTPARVWSQAELSEHHFMAAVWTKEWALNNYKQ